MLAADTKSRSKATNNNNNNPYLLKFQLLNLIVEISWDCMLSDKNKDIADFGLIAQVHWHKQTNKPTFETTFWILLYIYNKHNKRKCF